MVNMKYIPRIAAATNEKKITQLLFDRGKQQTLGKNAEHGQVGHREWG